MEQQPPSRSTPPPPPVPPDSSPGQSASPAPVPAAEAASNGADASPAVQVAACPVCREPRAEDARFCEECGFDYEGPAPAAAPTVEERSGFRGPVLWLVLVFWVVLAVGGLFFIYNAIWSL